MVNVAVLCWCSWKRFGMENRIHIKRFGICCAITRYICVHFFSKQSIWFRSTQHVVIDCQTDTSHVNHWNIGGVIKFSEKNRLIFSSVRVVIYFKKFLFWFKIVKRVWGKSDLFIFSSSSLVWFRTLLKDDKMLRNREHPRHC